MEDLGLLWEPTMEPNVYEQMLEFFDEFLNTDFNENPTLIAMVTIRDRLVKEYGDIDFANNVVASMKIDVTAATSEQAVELATKYSDVVVKWIETMRDNKFNSKNIIALANNLSLTYSEE